MMKQLFAVLALVALSNVASAQTTQSSSGVMNELTGGSRSTLVFGSGLDTTFFVGAGYSRTLLDNFLQGTVFANFAISDDFAMSAVVGPTLNLPMGNGGITNAFYLFGGAGLTYTSAGTGSTDFAYEIEAGKRFEIFPGIVWKPAFNMSGTTATGSDPIFQIIPAQFSFFF